MPLVSARLAYGPSTAAAVRRHDDSPLVQLIGPKVWFVTDSAEHCDQLLGMPRRDRSVMATTGLLRHIEQLARDLSKEAEREGALPTQTALALANSIKANIELVIRHLGPAPQTPQRPRRLP
jgi:hypothetical protein